MTAGSLPFQVICGDALAEMRQLQDNSVQLILTSPPYNIGKSYEKDGFANIEAYGDWMHELLECAFDKLADGGSLCWQVGNHVRDGSFIPLDYIFFPILNKIGFKLRNRVIWTFNFGLHAKRRLSGRYEALLWLTKSDDYKFNLDAVRVPQLYPGKRHAARKGRDGPSGNPLGKNPSDFWMFDGRKFFDEEAIWQIPNVKWNHSEYAMHPCQFPAELAERCILAFTDSGDLVVDPFSGTGTTPIVAKGLGRRGLGIEVMREYVVLSEERLASFEDGRLTKRPSGGEIEPPRTTERVAQVPREWVEMAAE